MLQTIGRMFRVVASPNSQHSAQLLSLCSVQGQHFGPRERERGRENDRLYILPFSYLFFPIVGAPTSNPSTGRTAGGQENIVPETAKKMFFFSAGDVRHNGSRDQDACRRTEARSGRICISRDDKKQQVESILKSSSPTPSKDLVWFLFQSDAVNVVCLAEHKFFMRLVQVIGSRRTSQAGVRRRGLTGCTHARTHAQAAAVSLE